MIHAFLLVFIHGMKTTLLSWEKHTRFPEKRWPISWDNMQKNVVSWRLYVVTLTQALRRIWSIHRLQFCDPRSCYCSSMTHNDEMCNFYMMYYVDGSQLPNSTTCFNDGNFHWSQTSETNSPPDAASTIPGTNEVRRGGRYSRLCHPTLGIHSVLYWYWSDF